MSYGERPTIFLISAVVAVVAVVAIVFIREVALRSRAVTSGARETADAGLTP